MYPEMRCSLWKCCQKISKFNSRYFFHKLPKIKILLLCTSLIYVQWICRGIPFWQPRAYLPAIFTIWITGFFVWKTQLIKYETIHNFTYLEKETESGYKYTYLLKDCNQVTRKAQLSQVKKRSLKSDWWNLLKLRMFKKI